MSLPSSRPAKGPRPPSEDPEVNAVRLGWTDKPTMAGYHWMYGVTMEIVLVMWDGDILVVKGHIPAAAKYLKIVTPRRPDVPPEAA